MKKNWLLILGVALLLVAAVLMVNSANKPAPARVAQTPATQTPMPHHEHSTSTVAKAVPAHFEIAPSRSSLGPTLNPESFTGVTREAYRAAQEIPVTLAQLPCYCHCDEEFGHKSLYSCFQGDHASHCAVCVQEALLALRLEKEQKMSPAQIRDTIIAQYSQ